MTDPTFAALEADGRVVWTQDVLRFGDTDANGHINNGTFSVLCESGRVSLLRKVLRPTSPATSYTVIVKVTIEFRAELNYPGKVRSATWIRHVGRSSVGLGQALFDDPGQLVATSQAVTVLMDAGTRRPLALNDATRAAAEAMLRPEPG